jgi:hypothetical protein
MLWHKATTRSGLVIVYGLTFHQMAACCSAMASDHSGTQRGIRDWKENAGWNQRPARRKKDVNM